jgi:EAL domain-containing protein (putative c-di-GMP-specific phosphodiesterase class I)
VNFPLAFRSQAPQRAALEPIIRVSSGAVIGYEALYRGPLPFRATRAWYRLLGGAAAAVCQRQQAFLAVNLDETELLDADLTAAFEVALAPAAGRLVIEWTERTSGDPQQMAEAAQRLLALAARLNAKLSIDDFSADEGYARLALLGQAIDYVKIDATLFHAALTSAYARRVITLMANSTRSVGARLILEGIERPHHLHGARSSGIAYVQGYLYAPLALEVTDSMGRRSGARPCDGAGRANGPCRLRSGVRPAYLAGSHQ